MVPEPESERWNFPPRRLSTAADSASRPGQRARLTGGTRAGGALRSPHGGCEPAGCVHPLCGAAQWSSLLRRQCVHRLRVANPWLDPRRAPRAFVSASDKPPATTQTSATSFSDAHPRFCAGFSTIASRASASLRRNRPLQPPRSPSKKERAAFRRSPALARLEAFAFSLKKGKKDTFLLRGNPRRGPTEGLNNLAWLPL